jgi:hypothetical protein
MMEQSEGERGGGEERRGRKVHVIVVTLDIYINRYTIIQQCP